MSRLSDMRDQHDRQFRRFRNLIIAFQVLVVVGLIWLLTHPEAIGGFAGRIAAGFNGTAA